MQVEVQGPLEDILHDQGAQTHRGIDRFQVLSGHCVWPVQTNHTMLATALRYCQCYSQQHHLPLEPS